MKKNNIIKFSLQNEMELTLKLISFLLNFLIPYQAPDLTRFPCSTKKGRFRKRRRKEMSFCQVEKAEESKINKDVCKYNCM